MAGSKDELVQLCNWLQQTKAIDPEFEALLWTSNAPLDILFEELRDGVILVKLVLFVEEHVEGERASLPNDYFLVTDGATFRRETNINLFLRKCVSLGAKRYFNVMDLERDRNRTQVLRTLKSFSKRLEKKMKKSDQAVKAFTVIPYIEEIDGKVIDTEITYYMKKKRNQNYGNYFPKMNEETEMFMETYLTSMNEDARSELMIDGFLDNSIPVHNKILQLRQKESGFQKKFLKTLEKIISSTTGNKDNINLYEIFKDLEEILTPLKKLHKRLFDKLLKNVNPGPVFVEMKMDFWIYAPFLVLLINAATLIETFEKNVSVKQEMEMIKSDMQKQIDAGDSSFPGTLDQLFYLPRQHLANYVVHLSAIIKSAKKELGREYSSKSIKRDNNIDLVKIVQHCIGAKTAMEDILNYVNHSVGENANKSILRDLGHQLLGLRIFPEDLASDYGALVFEGKILHKWEKDSKYVNRYMVCMQKLILISDIINKRGNRTVYSPKDNLEFHLFDPRIRYNVMETREQATPAGSQPLALTVVMTDNNLNPIGRPFNLKCRTSSSHETLKATLEQLFSASRVSSKFHPRHTHDYEVHESNGEFKEPPICGLDKCGNMISGLFVIGVFCKTCNKHYHNHCFVNNSPDSSYEDDIDLIRNLSRLDSDDESDNEDVDDKCLKNIYSDFESFKRNIHSYRIGSCILYSRDEENGVYKLAYKENGPDNIPRILKLVISRSPSTNKFMGTNVLMRDKEFDTFTDVVRYLKSSCSLKFMSKSKDDTSHESSKTSGNSSILDEYPEDIRPYLFVGDRKQALRGTPAGTYLIYPETNGSSSPFTISVSRGNASTPGRISIDETRVEGESKNKFLVKSFPNQRRFDSVSELIAHYKTKCNLLYPLITQKEEGEEDNDSVLSIPSSQYYYIGSSSSESTSSSSEEDSDEEDPKILKDLKATEFYGGVLNRFEAQRTLLEMGVRGLYMLRLRRGFPRELRMSLVVLCDKKQISSTFKKLRVVHIKVSVAEEEDDEGLKRHCYQMGPVRGFTFKDLIEKYGALSSHKYEFKYPYSP